MISLTPSLVPWGTSGLVARAAPVIDYGPILAALKTEAKGLWTKDDPANLKTNTVASFASASSQRLTRPYANASTLSFAGDFSVGGWMNAATLQDQVLISKWGGSINGWFIWPRSTGQFYFGIYGSFNRLWTAGTYSAGSWVHVMMVRDGAVLRPYVNGVATATVSCPTDLVGEGGNPNFSIGSISNGNLPFNGQAEMLSAWNRALTPAEVATLGGGSQLPLSALSPGIQTGMVSFWHLNERGPTRYDAFGSNDLDDNNGVTHAQGPVTYTATEHAVTDIWTNEGQNVAPFADLTAFSRAAAPVLSASGAPTWDGTVARHMVGGGGMLTPPFTVVAVVDDQCTTFPGSIIEQGASGVRHILARNSSTVFRYFDGLSLDATKAGVGRAVVIGKNSGAMSTIAVNGGAATSGALIGAVLTGFSVGAHPNGANKFKGSIERLMLLDRALTVQEEAAVNSLL